MNKETKAMLEIIIREVRDIIATNPITALQEIKELLDSWASANDLHPERVIHQQGAYSRKQE